VSRSPFSSAPHLHCGHSSGTDHIGDGGRLTAQQFGAHDREDVGSPRVTGATLSVSPPDSDTSDSVWCADGLFAVADGADHLAGTGATALDQVRRLLGRPPNPRRIRRALHTANWALWYGNAAWATVTLAMWTGRRFVLGHVGDSRAYLLGAAGPQVLTTDHGTDRAGDDTDVRRLGASQSPATVEVIVADLSQGDRLLLVTDGLWRSVAEDQLAVLRDLSPARGCDWLAARVGVPREDASAVIVSVDL
jgi:hypothetical protein